MAELQASFTDPKLKKVHTFERELPLNEVVTLGRDPKRSTWAMPQDESLSGLHATVCWTGKHLLVKLWDKPLPSQTPYIRYRGKETKDPCEVQPGDSFVLSKTSFALRDDPPPPPPLHEATMAQALLRREEVVDGSHVFQRMMAELPEAIRNSVNGDKFADHIAGLLHQAIDDIDFITIVTRANADGTTDVNYKPLGKYKSRGSAAAGLSKPSRRVIDECLRGQGMVVCHLLAAGPAAGQDMTFRPVGPGVPWAICAPFQMDAGSRAGLYVEGRFMPRSGGLSGVSKNSQPELQAYQKVIDLGAALIESSQIARRDGNMLAALSRLVPQKLLNNPADGGSNLLEFLAPRSTPVTAMFCDIRGSSKNTAEKELMQAWNELTAAIEMMTTIITERDGIIAGFQGDGVLAFWGWPHAQPNQMQLAAEAAIKICDKFDKSRHLGVLKCCIGIAHGNAVAGLLGSSDLAKVDVFGPVVNLASRLETMTKHFGVRVLIDQAIHDDLARIEPGRQQWRTRQIGRVRPVGMIAPELISEVLPKGNLGGGGGWTPLSDRQIGLFEAASLEFQNGTPDSWAAARRTFESMPDGDMVAKRLLDYMHAHDDLPPTGWDGVLEMLTK